MPTAGVAECEYAPGVGVDAVARVRCLFWPRPEADAASRRVADVRRLAQLTAERLSCDNDGRLLTQHRNTGAEPRLRN